MRVSIEVQPPAFLARRSRRGKVGVGVAILAAVLLVPTMVMAGHDFSDVPDDGSATGQFHDEIGAMKDAGITQGCGGGKFCPTDAVDRRSMAAFLGRGLGRVAMGDTALGREIPVEDGDGGSAFMDVGSVEIDVPGAGAGVTQYVHVDASANLYDETSGSFSPNGDCPCYFEARLVEDDVIVSPTRRFDLFNSATTDSLFYVPFAHQHVFATSPGVHTYTLQIRWADRDDTAGRQSVWTSEIYPTTIIATTFPFEGEPAGVPLAREASEAPTPENAAG